MIGTKCKCGAAFESDLHLSGSGNPDAHPFELAPEEEKKRAAFVETQKHAKGYGEAAAQAKKAELVKTEQAPVARQEAPVRSAIVEPNSGAATAVTRRTLEGDEIDRRVQASIDAANATKDPLTPLQALQLALPPSPFDEAVMGAEKLQSTDYYYQLYEKFTVHGDGVSGDAGTDDHEMWGSGSKRLIEVEAKRILKDAVREAECRGWGTVPVRMRSVLRQMVSNEVDWQERLRRWIGINGDPATRYRTRRRVDRKYPGLFPGVKRQRGVRVAVAIDQSGSVYDALLGRLLAVIAGLSEVASVTIVPFDTAVVEEKIETLGVGQVPSFERVACGGTNFDCITEWVNDPKNAGVYDVLIVATDGGAPHPQVCCIPRVWVVGPGCTLDFTTDEEVITLTDETV